jgi:hypothetical protein
VLPPCTGRVRPILPGTKHESTYEVLSLARSLRVGWLAAALIVAATPSVSAQGKRPFEDLGRYLEAGDTVFVVERTQGASSGVVSRITSGELFVFVSGQERRLTKEDVAWIERSPDPVWDGAISGLLVGAAWGVVMAGFAAAGPSGPDPLLLFFAFSGAGAAAGAAVDASIRGKIVVYGKPPGYSFLRRPVPVSSLGELWSRVPPGASIKVLDASVGERRGSFVKASSEALTIEIDSNELTIPTERVQLIQRRSYMPAQWTWIGMALGGTVGAVKKHDPYNIHAKREDAGKGVLAGGVLGYVVSAAAVRYTDVYRPASSTTPGAVVWPVVGSGRRGVALTVTF